MTDTPPMQDWATQSIRDSVPVQDPPKDFQGDVIEIGAHVLFAVARGQLGEGVVVALNEHPGTVTVKSLRDARRVRIVEAEGCIRVVTT